MDYLEREASKLYFDLAKFSFHQEYISWTQYLDRLLALKSMCTDNDPIKERAKRTLLAEEWDYKLEWNEELETEKKIVQENTGEAIKEGLSQDKNGYLQFLSRKKGLTDWEFHQYDVDWFPSIPHGHFNRKKQPKLDCYLGWVYQGSKQTNRLSRKLIITLWNDNDFRVFAARSIHWYILEYPIHNWRVTNPYRLPRRR